MYYVYPGEVIDMIEKKGVDFLSLPVSVPMDEPYVVCMHCIAHKLHVTVPCVILGTHTCMYI